MKKVVLSIVSLCIGMMLQAQTSATVNETTAGTLTTLLTASQKSSLDTLVLTGTIDARDFKTMRDSIIPNLSVINLSGATIVDYNGTLGTAGTTSTDYPANTIPQYAFYSNNSGKTSLVTITIPNSVTSIGTLAFCSCNGLIAITIPSSVISIATEAFCGCKALITVDANNPNYSSIAGVLFDKAQTTLIQCPTSITGSYAVPSSCTSIGDFAFYNCISLTSVTIPPSVTSIANEAFENCSGLTAIIIPSSVTSIGGDAFDGCDNLTSVTIPTSVTSIGVGVFYRCTKLAALYALSVTPVDLSSSSGVFSYVPTSTCILYVPSGSKATYAAANQWSAFTNIVEMPASKTLVCTAGNLSSLLTAQEKTVLDTLTLTGTIDARDFVIMRDSMPKLAVIDLSGATIVDYNGTLGTAGTYSKDYPANVIPQNAFFSGYGENKTLTSIVIPPSVTTIGSDAFGSCIGLKTFPIPPSVTSIEQDVFANCSGLSSISIPSSITFIGNTAFGNCSGYITVDTNNPNYSSIAGVLFNKNQDTLIHCPSTFTGNYIIPSSVTSIGQYAFWGCGGMTSISIPSSVTSIGEGAFDDCHGLITIAIPSSVTNIGQAAFWACTGLTSIIIPSTVTTIGQQAFGYCSNLKSLYACPITPVNLSSYPEVFISVDTNTCILYVPVGSQASYTVANQWKGFAHIVSMTSVTANTIAATVCGSYLFNDSTYNATGTYTQRLKNVAGGDSVITLNLTVNALPTITATATPNSITAGASSVLLAGGGSSYSWCNGVTTASQTVSPTATYTYSVTGTDGNGCKNSAIIMVAVSNITAVDSSALITGIVNVKGLLAYSVVGTAAGDYPQSAFNDLSAALSTAIAVDGIATTQTAVDNALDTLHIAATIFQAAIITTSPKVSVSTNSARINASLGSSASITVTSNTTWSASSNQSWLTVNPNVAISGNGKLILTATYNNTLVSRYAKVIISGTGVSSDTISVTQAADSLVIIKQVADTSLDLSALSKHYNLSNYFAYYGNSIVSYSISSNNIAVVSGAIANNGFGLILNGKGSGIITLSATSSSGATASLQFTVTVTSTVTTTCSLSVFANINPVSCNSGNDGSIEVSVSGGTTPYTFKWSTTYSGNTLSNMPAGIYSLVVRDSAGCLVTKTLNITQPSAISITPTVTMPSCVASNGKIVLAVSGGTAPYAYKWNDGSSTNTLNNKAAGVYSITVSDASTCSQSQSLTLSNAGSPILNIDTIVSTLCNQKTGSIAVSGGDSKCTYKWNDGASTLNRTSVSPGNYILTVTDSLGCMTMISTTVPVISAPEPSISLVTVSQISAKNLLIWLRDETNAIDHYNIYRESNTAGKYNKIDAVSYDSISVYTDTKVNPQTQSWRYKLSAVDYCGNEVMANEIYKTMCLQQSPSILPNTANLLWDSYEGEDYYSYIIYRQSKSKGIEIVDTVSANVNRYIDTQMPTDILSYYVAIDLPSVIDPTKLKSDTGPFSQSLSNMAEAQLTSVAIQTLGIDVMVFPNPASKAFTVVINGNKAASCSIALLNSLGQTVYTSTTGVITKTMVNIDASALLSGVYTLKVASEACVITKQVVIAR